MPEPDVWYRSEHILQQRSAPHLSIPEDADMVPRWLCWWLRWRHGCQDMFRSDWDSSTQIKVKNVFFKRAVQERNLSEEKKKKKSKKNHVPARKKDLYPMQPVSKINERRSHLAGWSMCNDLRVIESNSQIIGNATLSECGLSFPCMLNGLTFVKSERSWAQGKPSALGSHFRLWHGQCPES